MLFTSFEVIQDEDAALKRLGSADFDPQTSVVLDGQPGFPSSPGAPAQQVMQYREISPDEIELEVSSSAPAILLFNDSYHDGWKAFVNGMERPVIHANYNFMATMIPSGAVRVVFRFQPRFFTYGAYAALAGGLLFLCVFATLYLTASRASARVTVQERSETRRSTVRKLLQDWNLV